jgi:hypothetical protein
MAKNCKVGDVLYWRDRTFLFEEQPKGPLVVVDIIPAPEKVTKYGYQWLSVADKEGNILSHGILGNTAFGSHLFRKASQKIKAAR